MAVVTADDTQTIREAFDYAQGKDVPGWEAHLLEREVYERFAAALDRLAAENERLTRERDAYKREAERWEQQFAWEVQNKMAAEAVNERLRAALTQIAMDLDEDSGDEWIEELAEYARAALAGGVADTAA